MSARSRSLASAFSAAAVVALAVLAVYTTAFLLGGGSGRAGERSLAPILIATVVVALGMQPSYVRLRRWFDDRYGVATVAPFELLRRLPESVTGELPAEDIPQHMVRVLAEGLRTHHTALWLKVSDGYRLAACWPPGPIDNATTSTWVPLAFQIRHQGTALAELRIVHLPPRSLSRLERRLVAAYANQASQVVRMLALRATLAERRAELVDQTRALREARSQLLEIQEVERRLLERDLHDGAQQQLLALALGVRLARQLADRAPARSTDLVTRAAGQAREIAKSLTSLSSGLTPRLLATEGLAAALRATLSGATTPIVVSEDPPDGLGPLPTEVIDALYFVATEAAQNATKHAAQHAAKHAAEHVGVTEVRIALRRDQNTLTMTVSDRGAGFEPAFVATAGQQTAGLRNMHERMAALGGRLEIDSAPGRGTVITARVPVPEPVA